MVITRTGLIALVSACAVSGAGGAYLATRTTAPAAIAATINGEPLAEPAALSDASPGSPTEPDGAIPTASLAGQRPKQSTPRERPVNRRVVSAPAPPVAPVRSAPTDPGPVQELSNESPRQTVAPMADEPAAPREPEFEELVINSDVVLGLQMDTTVTSETARVEDEVVARVARDVRVGERVAIPSGATAYGEVVLVERGGRLRERARLGVRFTSILLSDGSRVPIATDVVVRDGDSASRESAAKIGGGAIGGAILGGILGGAKGAAIGGSAGAGAGTAAVLAGGRNAATLAAGTPITIRLTSPATVAVSR